MRGIACDILREPTKRQPCAAARSATGGTAQPVAQPVARQCPGTVDTADAHKLSKPHGDGSRGHTQARDDTITSNSDFPAPASQKSQHNQHVLSFNALTRASRRRGERRSRREQRAGRKAPRPEATQQATLAPRATSGQESPAPRSDACDEQAGRPGAPKQRVRRAGRKAPRPEAARATSRQEGTDTPPQHIRNTNGGRAPSVRGPRLRARPQSAGRSDLARHFYGSSKTSQ